MSNKWDIEYLKTQIKLLKLIDAVYNEAAREAALIGTNINIKDPERIFSFADYPTTKKRVDTLMNAFNKHIKEVMIKGINAAWGISNSKNDELCRKVHRDTQTSEQIIHCDTVRQAFIDRKTSGLNLSDRVWNYTTQFKNEIELSLDCGIRDGLSASEMSRELKQYLKYPDKLFRRVRDEHGILQLSKRAAAFHPGQGVYRSSYKNARRLAATETNIAYRTADHLRWQDMDFVVGIKVELSNNHTCLGADGRPHAFADICDDLQGKYPKDFKFVGWHPHCRCHATPILKSLDEMNADTRSIIQGKKTLSNSVNQVSVIPDVFNKWINDNRERANGWASMPYFVRDNPQYIRGFEVDTYSPIERIFTRATRTNEAMAESLGIFLQRKYPEMPNTEKAAIYHYTQGNRSAYRELNNQLRKGKLTEFNEAFSELLSKGLSKISPIETTVYRTVRLNKTQLRGFYEKTVEQAETTFKGFTSTSLERSTAVNFAANHIGRKQNETDVLLVIQGKTGHRIEDFSQFGGRFAGKRNQKEVLFDKGAKCRFDKMVVEDGWYVFYLTEI